MAARAAMTPSALSRDPTVRLSRAPSRSKTPLHMYGDHQQHGGEDFTPMPVNPSANMASPLAEPMVNRSRSLSRGRQSQASYNRPRDEVNGNDLQRSHSTASHRSARSNTSNVSRSNTLKKQKSLGGRKGSLKRSSSKRSARAGAIGGITYDDTTGEDTNSVFYTPVPTSGDPTETLATRFQSKFKTRYIWNGN